MLPYARTLAGFVAVDCEKESINVFFAFNRTGSLRTMVTVIDQDRSHVLGKAHSSHNNFRMHKSDILSFDVPRSGCLTKWAAILLVIYVMMERAHAANANRAATLSLLTANAMLTASSIVSKRIVVFTAYCK